MAQSEYTVAETDPSAEVCLRLTELSNEQLGTNVIVRLNATGVTASPLTVPLPTDDSSCNSENAIGDYEIVQMFQVEFSSTSTVGAISCTRELITINDDTIVEDPEIFIVSIIDILPQGVTDIDLFATSATVSIISDGSDRKYNVSN